MVSRRRDHSRRAIVLLLLVLVAAMVAISGAAHERAEDLARRFGSVVEAHPAGGAAVLFVLSMLSAMVAFFSTAAVVPIAIAAWGKAPTLVLLWSGWFAGGIASFAIGRHLGRGVVARLVPRERLERYERTVHKLVGFRHVLLFQVALPSEIPGYVLGTMRYRFGTYLAALALAELPYAIGAVYLADSFLEGNALLLIAIGAAGVALSWWAAHLLHARLEGEE